MVTFDPNIKQSIQTQIIKLIQMLGTRTFKVVILKTRSSNKTGFKLVSSLRDKAIPLNTRVKEKIGKIKNKKITLTELEYD